MKPYRDPFPRELIRSRARGVLAAAALAGVMLGALSMHRPDPRTQEPVAPVQPSGPAPAAKPTAHEPEAASPGG